MNLCYYTEQVKEEIYKKIGLNFDIIQFDNTT